MEKVLRVLVYASLLGIGLLTGYLAYVLSAAFQASDASFQTAIITAGSVMLAAIYGKYLENRHSVESQFRSQKIELFEEIMEGIQLIAKNKLSGDQLATSLEGWKLKSTLWGSPKVMQAFLSLGTLHNPSRPITTVGDLAVFSQWQGSLILAMRKDLGLSNRGIMKSHRGGVPKETALAAVYFLKNSEDFLAALEKDPTTPISELEN